MITLRPGHERGSAERGWLDSRFTFSFGEYDDPAHVGFRSLRVMNEDIVSPGMGFGMHPHRDMEILTYVIAGRLAHHDSMGNGSEIVAGQLQSMSAGSGLVHSEKNPSQSEPAHFLQIWIEPREKGGAPRYAEWLPPADGEILPQRLLASPDGRDGSAPIAQDVFLYLLRLQPGARIDHPLASGRGAWLQVIRGEVQLEDDALLSAGDGASVEKSAHVHIAATTPVEALLFDLA